MSPGTMTMPRMAVEDVEVGGVTVPKGEAVVVMLTASTATRTCSRTPTASTSAARTTRISPSGSAPLLPRRRTGARATADLASHGLRAAARHSARRPATAVAPRLQLPPRPGEARGRLVRERIRRVGHVGLAVRDLDRAVDLLHGASRSPHAHRAASTRRTRWATVSWCEQARSFAWTARTIACPSSPSEMPSRNRSRPCTGCITWPSSSTRPATWWPSTGGCGTPAQRSSTHARAARAISLASTCAIRTGTCSEFYGASTPSAGTGSRGLPADRGDRSRVLRLRRLRGGARA